MPATMLTVLSLQAGDLLFQDLDCGPLCDAIEHVTPGLYGGEVTHVAMMVDAGNVIEAIGSDVHLTPISEFLGRTLDKDGNPKVFVSRLKDTTPVPGAIAWAKNQLTKPYDGLFEEGDTAFYCSELIQDAFNSVTPMFEPIPMTFRKPGQKKPFPAWKQYFEEIQQPIPEGAPGSNPGHLSQSPLTEYLGRFGKVDRWSGP